MLLDIQHVISACISHGHDIADSPCQEFDGSQLHGIADPTCIDLMHSLSHYFVAWFRPFSFCSVSGYIISRLVQMPLNTTAAPMVMHTTYEFSELLLQAGVPDDLDAENVCTAGFVESI